MRKEFIDAVQARDKDLVKIMLTNSLLVDPSGDTFDYMLKYAIKSLNDLIEEYDGGILENDTSLWNKKYLDEQFIKLEDNFSKERIDFVKLLCSTILNEKLVEVDRKKRMEKFNKSKTSKQEVGTVIAVSGVITTVAGIVLSKPIIIGVGTTSIIIGGVLYYIDQR